MKKLTIAIATVLSLALPGVAFAQSKTPSKPKLESATDRAYLKVLNQVLAQAAPEYLKVSDQDKLDYGRYTCQALDSQISLDQVFMNHMKAMVREVPPGLHRQAGFFIGSSMQFGVNSFCPNYLPELNEWIKEFVQQ